MTTIQARPRRRNPLLFPRTVLGGLLATAVLVTGCSSSPGAGRPETGTSTGSGPSSAAADQGFPDILEVKLTPRGGRTFDVDVTVSSPYDTPERYADGWRVLSPQGEVLGTHELTHDHQSEQPFTRTQSGLTIPEPTTQVTVEGRDHRYGFGGQTATAPVPGDDS